MGGAGEGEGEPGISATGLQGTAVQLRRPAGGHGGESQTQSALQTELQTWFSHGLSLRDLGQVSSNLAEPHSCSPLSEDDTDTSLMCLHGRIK